ncbi:MAG: phosphate ABC transporter permease subunit PstC [Chthoniobacteraceae bacterium]|nr:phosphate ABC transporter permease subunit PstC [Chthoniobacteraceae bacterium]
MKNPNRFDRKRLRLDHVIKWFFASNALLAIVVLALITLFLFREGAGFFPQNLQNLRLYRMAGLEYVGLMRDQVEAHTALNRSLQDLRMRQVAALLKQGKTPEEAAAALAPFDAFAAGFDDSVNDLRGLVSDLTDSASAIKEKAKIHEDALEQRRFLLKAGKSAEGVSVTPVDFDAERAPLRASLPLYQAAARAFHDKVTALLQQPPALPVQALQPRFNQFEKAAQVYLASFPKTERGLREWNPDAPVPWIRSVTSFLFGTEWITNSFWQDWYGILPLLAGSLLVGLIALVIAVPLGVSAAIYVSELARPAEARFIKPFLEFIAAIPSVVLGFFGIAVLGEGIRRLTQWEALSWISAFPIAERLNAFTAGALLALMAIPTIFSLSEDALNSVPRAFKEASYALGATRLQTVFRVLVPAALSGILSAVLLGFGRVIGETMVVLLCAGNRIAIPDFTGGLGALFQPVHTMTGIVAQELGEVPSGSIHYRALFIVGLFLFFLALGINWLAQAVVRRFKVDIG